MFGKMIDRVESVPVLMPESESPLARLLVTMRFDHHQVYHGNRERNEQGWAMKQDGAEISPMALTAHHDFATI